MTSEEDIQDILGFVIQAGDNAQAKRLPPGSQARLSVTATAEFQAAYTSRKWNEKKKRKLDAATLGSRPAHTVVSHRDGWMTVRSWGGAEYEVTPQFWEPA